MSTNTSGRLDPHLEVRLAFDEWQALEPVLQSAIALYNIRVADGIHTSEEVAAKCELCDVFIELTRAKSDSAGFKVMPLREVAKVLDVVRRGISAANHFISAIEAACAETSSSASAAEQKGPSEGEDYALLGVHPDCTDDEFKKAYYKKVNYWHPDKFYSVDIPIEMKELAKHEMARSNDAYERLTKVRFASKQAKSVEEADRAVADGSEKARRAPSPYSSGGKSCDTDHEENGNLRVQSQYKSRVAKGMTERSFWIPRPGQVVRMLLLIGIFWLLVLYKPPPKQQVVTPRSQPATKRVSAKHTLSPTVARTANEIDRTQTAAEVTRELNKIIKHAVRLTLAGEGATTLVVQDGLADSNEMNNIFGQQTEFATWLAQRGFTLYIVTNGMEWWIAEPIKGAWSTPNGPFNSREEALDWWKSGRIVDPTVGMPIYTQSFEPAIGTFSLQQPPVRPASPVPALEQTTSSTPIPTSQPSTVSISDSAVFKAGVGGVGYPSCIYCPEPSYSEQARAEKVQGRVVLQAVIQRDGHATNIQIVKNLGAGLEDQAIEAIRTWRFKPALGPDGTPVPTITPIEITFRLLDNTPDLKPSP